MFARVSPALAVFGGSVLLLAGLLGALYWTPASAKPLEIYCAAAMVKTVDTIAKDFEAECGQQVIIHPGSSRAVLNQMAEAQKGDLFLPADDSFVHEAETKKLVGEVMNVASMHAVVIVRPGYRKEVKTWDDFLAASDKIGLANPEATALGKLVKQGLQGRGLWAGLQAVKPSYLGDVNEVGNSVANTDSSDVGITWDPLARALAQKDPNVKIVELKELESVKARVKIAVVKATTQRDHALRFIAFLRAKDRGAIHLKKAGYADVDEGEAMNAIDR